MACRSRSASPVFIHNRQFAALPVVKPDFAAALDPVLGESEGW